MSYDEVFEELARQDKEDGYTGIFIDLTADATLIERAFNTSNYDD